jgi:diguanylate cyclase (GGDEF)-like protein
LALDNFKSVNDSLGHEAGDEALVEAARRIERSLRAEDTVARLGGDEFVVLMEDIAGAEDTILLAERIAEGLREPLILAGREASLGASIGIAVGHPDGGLVGAEDLLRDADAAMYAVKHGGKAGYGSFDPTSMKRGGRSPPEA